MVIAVPEAYTAYSELRAIELKCHQEPTRLILSDYAPVSLAAMSIKSIISSMSIIMSMNNSHVNHWTHVIVSSITCSAIQINYSHVNNNVMLIIKSFTNSNVNDLVNYFIPCQLSCELETPMSMIVSSIGSPVNISRWLTNSHVLTMSIDYPIWPCHDNYWVN